MSNGHESIGRSTDAFWSWCPKAYLREYYSTIEAEEEHTLQFLVNESRALSPDSRVLEFGIGPTLHHVLPLARHAREIHVVDLLPANLEEIRRWQLLDPAAHDWSLFTRRVLELEGTIAPSASDIYSRETLARRLITQRVIGNARYANPLQCVKSEASYDCVLTCYCADSATDDKGAWHMYMRNIATLLAPGGRLIVAALRNCSAYRIGSHTYPAAGIDEHDVAQLFASLGLFDTQVQVAEVPERLHAGYASVVLASARAH